MAGRCRTCQAAARRGNAGSAGGWERAVETALGDYLEAVCVDGLDALAGALEQLRQGPRRAGRGGERSGPAADSPARRHACGKGQRTAGGRVHRSPACSPRRRSSEPCRRAARWRPDQSIITRSGEWIGRDWLRVSRGADQHAGVIEREHRLKGLRSTVA